MRIALTAVAAVLVVSVLAGGSHAATGWVFQPESLLPAENPCSGIDDAVYDQVRVIVGQVLSAEAGVVADIDNQVWMTVDPKEEQPVTVQIVAIERQEFVDQYPDEVDGLREQTDRDELRAEAAGHFDKLAGFAYPTDAKNANGTYKIKIALFCKPGLRHMVAELGGKAMKELVIHELVHAKLSAMTILRVPPADLPFCHHREVNPQPTVPADQGGDKEFYDEINRLLEVLEGGEPEPPPPGAKCGRATGRNGGGATGRKACEHLGRSTGLEAVSCAGGRPIY